MPSFEIIPADADESSVMAKFPSALVKKLSKLKAATVAEREECKGKTIIAADTIVYLDKVYGKPGDYANSVKMLSELSGRTHSVYTGVTIRCRDRSVTFFDRSSVRFKDLTESEIIDYVNEFKPFDKAGAYGIQDKRIVLRFKGSYTNIIGLPLEKLDKALRKTGVTNDDDRTVNRFWE